VKNGILENWRMNSEGGARESEEINFKKKVNMIKE